MGDPIFQRSLQDLIKGIRANKRDVATYISQSIADIKNELKSTDPFLKSEAVRKLTYLQMIGYNVSWASFGIVEVMSQPRFAHKRIGYLAANQSFNDSTDVILLTTNLFKKEFSSLSANQYEIGVAINCLANIATKDLARDCLTDLVTLTNNSRPYIRKKAVLAMYKCYIKFPQGLRLTFDKLKERLDDSESSVVSTAVNVICELANKNPKNYLAMAPKFFKLLTSSSNNWMLIKVVKLLGSLVSEEPRLARKLLEPLATIIQNTGAKSLQYECINTVTEALPYTKREDGSDAKNVPEIIKICSDHLRNFIEDPDQNLKYLGLCGLVKLMESSPRSVVEHRELVLRCLNDDDVTIRSRALELLAGIVSRKSLVDLVHHLMEHVKHSEGNYRDEIINKILFMCSKEKFALVTDFAWYTSILLSLAVMQGSKHGNEVANQLIEISLRVDAVRPFAVESMLSMLLDDALILGQARGTVSEVLKAAAWIIGEYSTIVTEIANDIYADDDDNGYWIPGPTGEDIRSIWRGKNIHVLVIDALLHPRATNLPPHVQNAYVQAAMKVFIRATSDCREVDIASVIGIVRSRIGIILQSLHIEVQERASTFRHILAEFDVLSMTWQVAAEEDLNASATKSNSLFEDLLDMPIYTANSIKAVDDLGAAAATKKKKVLATIINEPFYAVHSKAQRRVPVPDGLDITVPFNKKECDKLFDLSDVPENINIANLYVLLPPPIVEKIGGFNDFEDYKHGSRPFSSSSNAADRDDRDHVYNDNRRERDSKDNYSGNQFNNSNSNNSRPDDSLFYLGGSKNNSSTNDPLARILAETFEEVPDGKKKKKSKKDKNGTKIEVNTKELLPAGAVSSDDEYPSKSKKGKSRSKNAPRSSNSPSVDLSSVDLSAPLRDDEVLTELKHRQVPEYIPPKQELNFGGGVGDGEEKKKKKSKDKKSVSNVVDSNDLLGLDWGSPAVVTPSIPVNDGDSKKKKKSSGKVWQPLYSFKNVDLYYSVQQVSNTNISVHCRVYNGNSRPVSVKFSLGGSHTLRPVSSSALQIVSNLTSGNEEMGSTDLLTHDHQPIMYNGSVSAMVHLTIEGENNSNSCGIRIPITIGFIPNKISQEDFSSQISKSSSRWGSCNLRVNIGDTKPKTALKLISSFLRAHVVEEETGKAISMSAKASNGGSIFILAKVSKDSNVISVDIKCLCNDKNESQKLSEIISQALNELVI